MSPGQPHRWARCGALLVSALALLAGPASAAAAGPPTILEAFSSQVSTSSAHIGAKINPNGSSTAYRVEYITAAAYEANLAAAKGGFTGALRSPVAIDFNLGGGSAPQLTQQSLFALTIDTAYRYRVIAHNSLGTVETSPPLAFVTRAAPGALLADSRGWEMVSPIDKNGGQVDAPGAIAGGGVLQAGAGGGAITYGSAASFAAGQGAPPASQYLATRAAAGWATENLTVPIFSSTYDSSDQGVPYQLFSADLARGLLLNGDHCRGGASGCAVDNPPLAGSGAPAGYQNYYLREGGAYASLLTPADVAGLDLGPAAFDLRFAGASPDLRHVALESCAALVAGAGEAHLGEGCDPAQPNLYEWSAGAGLRLVNGPTPGAALAAGPGAVSEDGSRVYFGAEGKLWLREGAAIHQVDESQGGGGAFQAASADGSVAFYTKAGHLYRHLAAGTSTDLTPGGGVVGVLATSGAGDTVYYQDASALQRWHAGATTQVAAGAAASEAADYPPATGAARVSSDAAKLLFVSRSPLTGYDNTDLITGNRDPEVFLYDAGGPTLTCVSCNPTNERPIGPATIPGAIPNGTAPASTDTYKPRVLAADGRRVFFDSGDALALTDSNINASTGAGIPDAYEWEAQGEGSCTHAGGCVTLISSGRSAAGATFIDASADGSDAFFLTDGSLIAADPGAVDLYDARVGGGFAVPAAPIPCQGDACQSLPSSPVDPTLTTLLTGKGNPAVAYHRLNHKKQRHKKHNTRKRHHKQRGRR